MLLSVTKSLPKEGVAAACERACLPNQHSHRALKAPTCRPATASTTVQSLAHLRSTVRMMVSGALNSMFGEVHALCIFTACTMPYKSKPAWVCNLGACIVFHLRGGAVDRSKEAWPLLPQAVTQWTAVVFPLQTPAQAALPAAHLYTPASASQPLHHTAAVAGSGTQQASMKQTHHLLAALQTAPEQRRWNMTLGHFRCHAMHRGQTCMAGRPAGRAAAAVQVRGSKGLQEQQGQQQRQQPQMATQQKGEARPQFEIVE